jgi:hypothetical protein
MATQTDSITILDTESSLALIFAKPLTLLKVILDRTSRL